MSISRRNNRALNRVLRGSLRAHERTEPPPPETPASDSPAYTLCADIPESYDDSYVRAIPKDPQNTFVYWELPGGHADGSLFADKGTAHVGNDEAVRIGQQLNESRKQRQTENCRRENQQDGGYQQEPRQNDYNQINWDNGNQYIFNGGNQQMWHNVDNYHHDNNGYHQINWDNGNQYIFDGGNQQHYHNVDNHHQDNNGYHQINRDNGNQYIFDGGNQQRYHNVDHCHQDNNNGYHQINWDNGNQYRRNDEYSHLRYLQDNIYQLGRDGGGDYTAYRRDDGAAFSEMLSDLIARCNKYLADYRQSGNSPSARALSSGLLCGLGEESRS